MINTNLFVQKKKYLLLGHLQGLEYIADDEQLVLPLENFPKT